MSFLWERMEGSRTPWPLSKGTRVFLEANELSNLPRNKLSSISLLRESGVHTKRNKVSLALVPQDSDSGQGHLVEANLRVSKANLNCGFLCSDMKGSKVL